MLSKSTKCIDKARKKIEMSQVILKVSVNHVHPLILVIKKVLCESSQSFFWIGPISCLKTD